MKEKDLISLGFQQESVSDEAGKYHFYYLSVGNCDFSSCPSNGPDGVMAELMGDWYVEMDGSFRFYDLDDLKTILNILHRSLVEDLE